MLATISAVFSNIILCFHIFVAVNLISDVKRCIAYYNLLRTRASYHIWCIICCIKLTFEILRRSQNQEYIYYCKWLCFWKSRLTETRNYCWIYMTLIAEANCGFIPNRILPFVLKDYNLTTIIIPSRAENVLSILIGFICVDSLSPKDSL